MDHLRYLCLVFVMLSRLFIAALWSPAGKGLTSWLSFVIFNCVFVTFPLQDQLSLNAGQKYCRMLQGEHSEYFRPSLSYHLSLRSFLSIFGWP